MWILPYTMKILVAEDESNIATLYKVSLEASGHQVQLTDNGEDCVKAYHVAMCHQKITRAVQRTNKSFYQQGSKRCSCCMVYLNWNGIRCPCCNATLRIHPKRRDSARLLNNAKLKAHVQKSQAKQRATDSLDTVTLISNGNC